MYWGDCGISPAGLFALLALVPHLGSTGAARVPPQPLSTDGLLSVLSGPYPGAGGAGALPAVRYKYREGAQMPSLYGCIVYEAITWDWGTVKRVLSRPFPLEKALHVPGHLGQLGPDPGAGAAPLTLAAAVARLGRSSWSSPSPLPPGDLLVLVHGHPVPDLKLPGCPPRRQGATVAAAGTAVFSRRGGAAPPFRPRPPAPLVQGRKLWKVRRLSSSCSMFPMPLSTTCTWGGWLPTAQGPGAGVASGSRLEQGSAGVVRQLGQEPPHRLHDHHRVSQCLRQRIARRLA